MSRFVYVNGRFVPYRGARVHVEDRGFQFADGVYEVWLVSGGRLCDAAGHFARLERSLRELQMPAPMGQSALERVIAEALRRNRVREGFVYLQITRGAAPRDHPFPEPAPQPTLVVIAKSRDPALAARRAERGISVITMADQRWARCDIKSVALLPNILAKQAAKAAGAGEAWLVDGDALVTEGAVSTAWIVDHQGRLITRALSNAILPGVTRASVVELAQALQIPVVERAFTVAEAQAAPEAFITSASNPVTAVIAIDGAPIGEGRPGPIAQRLREAYLAALG